MRLYMYKIDNYLQEISTIRTAAEHVGNLNKNTYYGITGAIFYSMSDVPSSKEKNIYPSSSHKIIVDELNFNISLSYSFANENIKSKIQ